MKNFLALLLLLFASCSTYERPSDRIVAVPEPPVPNSVDSVPQAAKVLITDLISRSKITQRIRVAFLPIENRVLDAGVSTSISNSLLDELVAHGVFDVLKDIDLRTIRQALAMQYEARGFLDDEAKTSLGKRTGADAVVSCTVSDAIQYWQIHVDITPFGSNVVATSATCYLPKRVAMRSQIYQ